MKLDIIYNEDCLEGMKTLPDKSIDMILCDLPYGTTACEWDTIIPLEPLWQQYKRIIKDDRVIILMASQPFTSSLVMSNLGMFKYEWIWNKSTSAGFIHAKNMPLKRHENILVFSVSKIAHKSLSKRRMIYNPQGLVRVNKLHKRPYTFASSGLTIIGDRPSHRKEFNVEYENYPISILDFKEGNNNHIHPTQKPIALFEYLIKTYSNKGDMVLDNCMGSGTTAIACKRLNRHYIGFEINPEYCKVAEKRLENLQLELIK